MRKRLKTLLLIAISIFVFFISVPSLLAATAKITITSSSSKVVVGNTFTVTIKLTSSSTMGSWGFTPSYDKNKLKLTSGDVSVADSGKVKSKTYTYKFKAIASGSVAISLKTYEVYAYDAETPLTTSVSPAKVTIITQSQLEASYSKDNTLKSLSVDGLKLSPAFNKNTTSYKVEAGANTTVINIKASANESHASVSGTGKKSVSEGENKFKITVTAQNGSTKTYTIVVNVVDPNPIKVTVNDVEYTIVKRESNIHDVSDFVRKNITINNQTVPALYNELNDFTLVGLKNSEGDINLYLYDEKTSSYKIYTNIKSSQLDVLPLEIDKTIKNYPREEITIDEVSIDALKIVENLYIIFARDIDTAEENYYIYDSITNTMVRYFETEEEVVKKEDNTDEMNKYKRIVTILGAETIIIIIILICVLISRVKKNKLKKLEIENKRKKKEDMSNEKKKEKRS